VLPLRVSITQNAPQKLACYKGVILQGNQLNNHQAEELFIALTKLGYPLEKVCEKALDTIKGNEDVKLTDKNLIREASKNLLNGIVSLRMHLERVCPEYSSPESEKRREEIEKHTIDNYHKSIADKAI